MRDLRSVLSLGLVVVALAAVGCGSRDDEGSATTQITGEIAATDTAAAETPPAGLPKLIGTVGAADDPDADEISLTTGNGTEVTTILPPGEYVLEIHDLSTVHNFHLGGPHAAVDVATDVAGTGEKTVTVLLQEPESYSYFCDAHPAGMRETFSIHDRIRTAH